MSRLFKCFPAGTIFNSFSKRIKIRKKNKMVEILFPSRLNAMAIDPSKIAINNNMIFTAGEIFFSIQLYKKVSIKRLPQKGVLIINSTNSRNSLITHAVSLMRQALSINDGFDVSIREVIDFRHSGLGTSSSLIASVACAINELYGNPISPPDFVKYIAQNHVEEVQYRDDLVQQVQSIGGSAASGVYDGGLIIIAGENKVIRTVNIPNKYRAVIGIPKDYKYKDAYNLMIDEEMNLNRFIKTGKKYGKEIAYRVLHHVLPAMETEYLDLETIGDLIYDYRFKMGSIQNCSFTYPNLLSLANKLAYLKTEKICQVLSLSSVGPGFFAITENTSECVKAFEKAGLNVMVSKINNKKYKVLRKL